LYHLRGRWSDSQYINFSNEKVAAEAIEPDDFYNCFKAMLWLISYPLSVRWLRIALPG
jgi:hypothetical protein